MEHKYFEVSQSDNGNLKITFSQEAMEEGKKIILTDLNLNIEEADYICSAIGGWLKGKKKEGVI